MSMEKIGEIVVPTVAMEETINTMMSMVGPMIILMFLIVMLRSVMKTTAEGGVMYV